jgi:two-component system sensor histidine kinase CpxA
MPIPDPERHVIERGTLILAAESFYGTPLFFDFKPWLAALGGVVAVFALCWLPFVRSLTRTVSGITRATDLISRGNFDRHLPEDRGDELGQLAGAINRMADRLSGFVTGQKRFLGDIAHELCAPIARIEFGVGILEHRATEADREAVADVRDEIRQMSALVSELLLFSKAGMEPQTKALTSLEIESCVRTAVTRESSELRSGAQVEIAVEPGLHVLGDTEFVVRAISNLVRNAIRYAGAAGPIRVSTHRDGAEVVVLVADSGPGLPQQELERIFAPFYRLDTSRNRESGGAGLGLAIVKSCVEACQGRVQCRNGTPTGLEVEIRLNSA